MKTLALAVMMAVMAVGVVPASVPQAQSWNRDEELRGMWVATIFNLDYPSDPTTSATALKNQADTILEQSARLGMNAIFLQVRPSADSLYPSDIFPWSRHLTGTVGVAPTGGFDPLAYWIEGAHALGMELHAWINPFRITRSGAEELAALPSTHPAVLHPEWVVEHEENYYFNPGIPEVRALVIQGALEIATEYDIDGLHMDDYFYPGRDFDDEATYLQYGGGIGDIHDWRRENINQLVETLGDQLEAENPDISYGIAPSGVWGDSWNTPGGSATTGGYESYHAAYADSKKWVEQGWIDYICPQIYWHIGSERSDYATIVRWWVETIADTGVELYVGMGDYRAGDPDPESPWAGTTAIADMLKFNDTIPQVTGELHFRYDFLVENQELDNLYSVWYADPPPENLYLEDREEGYMQGSDGRFYPDNQLTRGEVAALLARLTTQGEEVPLFQDKHYATTFPDVGESQWYADYVGFVQQMGVVNGLPDGTYGPQNPVTRAELVTLLAAYAWPGVTAAELDFSDVSPTHWAAESIALAVGAGWVNGYPDGTFRPDAPITRGEICAVLNRALERQGGTVGSNPYTDVPSSHWAYYHIMTASLLRQ